MKVVSSVCYMKTYLLSKFLDKISMQKNILEIIKTLNVYYLKRLTHSLDLKDLSRKIDVTCDTCDPMT